MSIVALFDFDGTVLDTEPAIMECYKYLFRKYRTEEEFTPELQVEVLGPSLESEMKKFFPEYDTQRLIDEYRVYQEAHTEEWIAPMPHAVEMLKALKESGVKTAVITSRLKASLIHLVTLFGLSEYFDLLIGHDDVTKDKPDPEGALRAMKELGGTVGIVIGDSITDIKAGKNANLYTVAYPSNPNKRQSLIDSKPDFMIEDLMELPEIIRKLG